MIELTEETIDTSEVLGSADARGGAVVLFLGTTRQFTGGRETLSLDYECYPAMARRKLQELESEALQRWELQQVCIVHRTRTPGAG